MGSTNPADILIDPVCLRREPVQDGRGEARTAKKSYQLLLFSQSV
jgi:hypothetical protein